MPCLHTRSAAALALLLLAGCLAPSAGPAPPGSPRDHQTNPRREGNALVFDEAQFRGEVGNLLDTLKRRLSAMTVRRHGACPEVVLRARKSLLGRSDPGIYVDGAMVTNTCILDVLNVVDVERVEVYPMGVPSRPEYRANPNGLILVFMRNAAE